MSNFYTVYGSIMFIFAAIRASHDDYQRATFLAVFSIFGMIMAELVKEKK